MSNKAPLNVRVPEEMLEQIEIRAQASGQTKTDIVTDALAKYLGDLSGANTDAISNLEQQVQHLNQYLLLRLTALEAKVSALTNEQNAQESTPQNGALGHSARHRHRKPRRTS